jgi:hypothetical protein
MRLWRSALPDGRALGAVDQLLTAGWAIALVISAVAGVRHAALGRTIHHQ